MITYNMKHYKLQGLTQTQVRIIQKAKQHVAHRKEKTGYGRQANTLMK